MNAISMDEIKELRERTGAGVLDCKNALDETGGDLERAVEVLRKKGLAEAAQRAGRVTAEGAVGSYIHAGGKIGVLVEVNCETDFVARTDEFQQLVKEIAMQIAAADPQFVSRDEVTGEVLDKEREIYRDQALAEGKPEDVVERIVDGKLEKFYGDSVLLEQEYIKDTDKTVEELIAGQIATVGENIQIRRFARFELGAGIEREDEDFVDEVMQQATQTG